MKKAPDTALTMVAQPGGAQPVRGSYQDFYFFGNGLEHTAQLGDYVKLSGPIPQLPRYALGPQFSRWYAYGEIDSTSNVQTGFGQHGVPLVRRGSGAWGSLRPWARRTHSSVVRVGVAASTSRVRARVECVPRCHYPARCPRPPPPRAPAGRVRRGHGLAPDVRSSAAQPVRRQGRGLDGLHAVPLPLPHGLALLQLPQASRGVHDVQHAPRRGRTVPRGELRRGGAGHGHRPQVGCVRRCGRRRTGRDSVTGGERPSEVDARGASRPQPRPHQRAPPPAPPPAPVPSTPQARPSSSTRRASRTTAPCSRTC